MDYSLNYSRKGVYVEYLGRPEYQWIRLGFLPSALRFVHGIQGYLVTSVTLKQNTHPYRDGMTL